MPKVSFTGPDGKNYSFQAPAGADQKFIDSAIRQIVLENVDTSQAKGGFGAAVESGVAGVKSALAAFAGRTGIIDTETAEQYMAEKEAEQRATFKPTEKGWLEAPLTKVGELAGQSLPYMVAPIAGAGVGLAAAGTAPAWLAAGIGSTALSALQFTGTNLQRQVDEGTSLAETDLLKAGATAVPQALLDTVALRYIPGVRRLFGEIGKDITEDQAKKIIERGILANMGAAGAKTASAEALTEVGQQALERFQAGLQVLDEEGRDELAESAIGGGVLGFLFGVPGVAGVRGAAEKRILEAEQKRREAEEKQQLLLEGPEGQALLPAPPVPKAIGMGDIPPRAGTLEEPQGELFPAELAQAQTFEEQLAGPRAAETVTEEAIPETPAGEQLPLELRGGRVGPEPVYGGVAETRMGEELTPIKRQMDFERALAERDAETQTQLDAIQAAGQRQRELEAAGLAEVSTPTTAPEAETTGAPTQPQQLELFSRREAPRPSRGEVMRREGVPPADPLEIITPEDNTVITEASLDDLALPKSSMARKRLIGKDIANPEQRNQVVDELKALAENSRIKPETRARVQDILASAMALRTQGEMFGPRGGILPEAIPRAGATDAGRTRTPPPPESTTERPTGEPSMGMAGMGDGSTTTQTATAGTVPESELTGLAGVDAGTKRDVTRGEAPQSTVTPPPPPIETPSTLTGAAKKNYEAYANQVTDSVVTSPVDALRSSSARVGASQDRPVLTRQDKVLENIASDIYSGENTKVANNIYKALPDDQKAKVDTFLQNFKEMEQRGNTTIAWLNAIQDADTQTREEVARQISKLVNANALPLQNRLNDQVVAALRNNDAVGALNALAERTTGTIAKLAKYLAGKIKQVNIQLVDDAAMRRRVFERTGKVEPDVKGVYFASDNTIYINTDIGLDAHTLLHEMTHVLVDSTLNNKAHPLTAQLQKLFDDVKGGLGTAYGASDLKEFAAEFMSNPEFRASLDRLYPGGGQISALRRIVNAIGNFLRRAVGMEPKKIDSAFDKADSIIYSIMEPGQTALQPTMTMNQASFLKKGDEPIAAMTFADKALPFLKQEQRDNIDAFFRSKGAGAAKGLVRMSLPLNALVDIAKNTLPSADRVEKLIQERSGTENKRHQMIEPIQKEATEFAKKASLTEMNAFNDVVYDSTTAGVDPTKPRETYKGDRAKLEAWDKLYPQFNKLPPEGKRLYTRMRDTYKKMYDEILKVVDQRLDSATNDPEANKRIKKDLLSKLASEAGKIDPYFPLTRDGDYWISYSVQGEGVQADFVVEAFKTPAARDRAMAELRDNKNVSDLELFSKGEKINYANAPSGSFMNSVFTTLKANKVDPEVSEQLLTLFLNSLPASSFAQSFRKRKGTTGYERDAVKAFRSKVYSISQQLANLEYGAKLNDVRDQLRKEAAEAYRKGDETAQDYFQEFDKRIDFAVNPTVSKWSQVATSYGFLATLGFNLSSAIVNLSQIPLMVLPYYGGKYGLGKTMGAIGRATKLYTNSGLSQDRETILGDRKRMRVAPSIQNYNFDDPNLPAYLKPFKYLVEVAQDLGQMNRSQAYDILDVNDIDNPLAKVNAASGFIFHHGERMNREIALAAAYDLEVQKLGKNPTPDQMREAAKQAVYLTELTNGGVAAAAAPRIAQNSLGRVMFMYKRYGVSMYYSMFKMARDMLKGESAEVRRAGMKQIAGIFLSAGMMAGVQGLPLYGVGALIYNMFREDDEDDADAVVRKFLGEGLYKGPVNLLTGTDVASRIGLSDLLFRSNPVQRDQEPMAEIMEFIGGPVYSVANRALRGVKDIQEGEVQRGVEQILPSAFGNVLKSLRFATEGVQTRRGDPILEDLGFGSAVSQFFGFAPSEYTRQLEINSVEKGKERAVTQKRTKLLRQYYMAVREGDAQEAQSILNDISEFNQRNPTVAIDGKTIQRSMKQHARTSAQMYNGVTYSKRYLPEFLESAREYE